RAGVVLKATDDRAINNDSLRSVPCRTDKSINPCQLSNAFSTNRTLTNEPTPSAKHLEIISVARSILYKVRVGKSNWHSHVIRDRDSLVHRLHIYRHNVTGIDISLGHVQQELQRGRGKSQ